jgi:hypothetical protein
MFEFGLLVSGKSVMSSVFNLPGVEASFSESLLDLAAYLFFVSLFSVRRCTWRCRLTGEFVELERDEDLLLKRKGTYWKNSRKKAHVWCNGVSF